MIKRGNEAKATQFHMTKFQTQDYESTSEVLNQLRERLAFFNQQKTDASGETERLTSDIAQYKSDIEKKESLIIKKEQEKA